MYSEVWCVCVCVVLFPRMQSSKISIHPQWNQWLPISWHCVRHEQCVMQHAQWWQVVSLLCDTQRFVFFTPKLLGLHVRVGSIQHQRILFFAPIIVHTESQCADWSKCCEWWCSRIYMAKCTACVIMFTRVWSDVSFDPEQNQ
jgi:hypothetical protein